MNKREWMDSVSARYEGGFRSYYNDNGNLIVPPPDMGDLLAYYVASEAAGAWDDALVNVGPDELQEAADDEFTRRMETAAEQLKGI